MVRAWVGFPMGERAPKGVGEMKETKRSERCSARVMDFQVLKRTRDVESVPQAPVVV